MNADLAALAGGDEFEFEREAIRAEAHAARRRLVLEFAVFLDMEHGGFPPRHPS